LGKIQSEIWKQRSRWVLEERKSLIAEWGLVKEIWEECVAVFIE
jgi:hypothetical protein